MTSPSAIDTSTLSIFLDIRNPYAYLALGPAIDFGRDRGLEINWLPLEVPSLKAPSEPAPSDDRGIKHRRSRAQAMAREIETYGSQQGLELQEIYRDRPTPAVVLGWLWLREHAPRTLEAFLVAVFQAYWSLQLDASSEAQVASVIQEVGEDPAAFRAWSAAEGPVRATELAAELADRGLTGVPGYLVEGEFFLGRQHLPMIGWLLDGQRGPGPI